MDSSNTSLNVFEKSIPPNSMKLYDASDSVKQCVWHMSWSIRLPGGLGGSNAASSFVHSKVSKHVSING